MDSTDASPENEDLRTRLHAMETKAKRLRNQRNSYSDEARSSAESRDGVQAQGKEIKDQINEKMEEQKSIRKLRSNIGIEETRYKIEYEN